MVVAVCLLVDPVLLVVAVCLLIVAACLSLIQFCSLLRRVCWLLQHVCWLLQYEWPHPVPVPVDPPLTPVPAVLMVLPLISIEFSPDFPLVEHPARIPAPRDPSAWTTGLPRIVLQPSVDVACESSCPDPIREELLRPTM
jgi:hypothetical protein